MTAVLLDGIGEGPVLRLKAPLSFWGGVGPDGAIVDVHHPDRGASIAGTVLVLSAGRGSSSSSSVLAELLRAGAGPAAILLESRDPIIVTGVLVAAELYDVHVPVVVGAAEEWLPLSSCRVSVDSATDPVVRIL